MTNQRTALSQKNCQKFCGDEAFQQALLTQCLLCVVCCMCVCVCVCVCVCTDERQHLNSRSSTFTHVLQNTKNPKTENDRMSEARVVAHTKRTKNAEHIPFEFERKWTQASTINNSFCSSSRKQG